MNKNEKGKGFGMLPLWTAILYLCFMVLPVTSSADWIIEAVDAPKNFYDLSSRAIAIDAGGRPLASGAWVTSTIDSAWVLASTSIALDSAARAHISYYSSATDHLKYATNVSGVWMTSAIYNTGSWGWSSAIVLDSNDKVHISLYDSVNADLNCATKVSAYTITAGAQAGGNISPSGSVLVVTGGSQTFTIEPNAGNQGGDVLVDGASVGNVASYVFSDVNANHAIRAFFRQAALPPVAEAGPDQTVEATSAAGASATLNGSGSTDPQNSDLTYQWSGPFGAASRATPMVALPLGTNEVALVVTDIYNLTSSGLVRITVQDISPPTSSILGIKDGAVYELSSVPAAGYTVTDAHSGVA